MRPENQHPLAEAAHFDLETLIVGITEANRHDEIPTGPAVGNECRMPPDGRESVTARE